MNIEGGEIWRGYFFGKDLSTPPPVGGFGRDDRGKESSVRDDKWFGTNGQE